MNYSKELTDEERDCADHLKMSYADYYEAKQWAISNDLIGRERYVCPSKIRLKEGDSVDIHGDKWELKNGVITKNGEYFSKNVNSPYYKE